MNYFTNGAPYRSADDPQRTLFLEGQCSRLSQLGPSPFSFDSLGPSPHRPPTRRQTGKHTYTDQLLKLAYPLDPDRQWRRGGRASERERVTLRVT